MHWTELVWIWCKPDMQPRLSDSRCVASPPFLLIISFTYLLWVKKKMFINGLPRHVKKTNLNCGQDEWSVKGTRRNERVTHPAADGTAAASSQYICSFFLLFFFSFRMVSIFTELISQREEAVATLRYAKTSSRVFGEGGGGRLRMLILYSRN